MVCTPFSNQIFLSTPSARRATERVAIIDGIGFFISIHALREEGDLCSVATLSTGPTNFYPRPPRGGRRVKVFKEA